MNSGSNTTNSSANEYTSAQDLLDQHIPEPNYIIKDLISPGLTIFAAAPKSGKSTLLTYLMGQISRGVGVFLTRPVKKSKVLYFGLEDGKYRIKKRLHDYVEKVLFGDAIPLTDLHFIFDTEKTGTDFIDELRQRIIKDAFDVVVIDVLHKIFDPKHNFGYQAQYDIMDALHRCAIETDTAIIVVHHTNKKANGGLQSISGTQGLTAAADNIIILNKSSESWSEAFLKLDVQGRDVESQEIWLELSEIGMDYIELPHPPISPEKTNVLKRIAELRQTGLTQTQIAKALDISQATVNRRIKEIKDNPQIISLTEEQSKEL